MRTLLFVALLSSIVGFSSIAPAEVSTRTYIIGVSPKLPKADRDEVLKQIILFLLQGTSSGDNVHIYDALNLQPITLVAIPNGTQYDGNPRARLQKIKAEIATLQKFFTHGPAPTTPEEGDIRAPQFLELVGSHLRQDSNKTTVVLIGSGLYRDSREPAFDISDGFYPSDGHITADQKGSIYGTADKREVLKGVTVHYSYLHENFTSDELRNRVARFWTLFVQQQEGILASFAADPGLVLDRSRQPVAQPFMQVAIDSSDQKLQMHRIKVRSDKFWIENDAPPRETAPPPVTKGKLKVGIRWKANVDIDLYIRPRRGATELYYGRNRSADGILDKDFNSSPRDSKGYETVEFFSDVDLNQVTAAVNFYSGESKNGITGEVRVNFDGEIYQGEFQIPAEHGNKGRETDQRFHSRYWQVLDLPKIVGIVH
jgi:hypothetical protein